MPKLTKAPARPAHPSLALKSRAERRALARAEGDAFHPVVVPANPLGPRWLRRRAQSGRGLTGGRG